MSHIDRGCLRRRKVGQNLTIQWKAMKLTRIEQIDEEIGEVLLSTPFSNGRMSETTAGDGDAEGHPTSLA